MAKFSMKDYENFMKEEANQNQLQKTLEDKNNSESYGSSYDYEVWLEKQKEEKRREEMMAYYDWKYNDYVDDDWEDDDDVDDDWEDDDDVDDDWEDDDDVDDDWEDDDWQDDDSYLLEVQHIEAEKIGRKAISRNRRYASEKAKKKATKSAEVLTAKFWKFCADIATRNEANHFRYCPDLDERDAFIEGYHLSPKKIRRLYYSHKAAAKKVNRVRVKSS